MNPINQKFFCKIQDFLFNLQKQENLSETNIDKMKSILSTFLKLKNQNKHDYNNLNNKIDNLTCIDKSKIDKNSVEKVEQAVESIIKTSSNEDLLNILDFALRSGLDLSIILTSAMPLHHLI
jgi:hypothetical protein